MPAPCCPGCCANTPGAVATTVAAAPVVNMVRLTGSMIAPLLGHCRLLARACLVPVIRVPRQNRGRAIDLLQQHDAHDLVWPGLRAESEMQVGLIRERRREAVGAADHEDGVAPAIV